MLIILIEIICILSRARKGKKFMEDSQFLADHLPPREELHQKGADSQTSEDQELQQLLSTFIESLKESIKVNTERPTDLKALFQKEPGETTRNEDLKIDSIYTKLVLIPERARYDFSPHQKEIPDRNHGKILLMAKTRKFLSLAVPASAKHCSAQNFCVTGHLTMLNGTLTLLSS